MSNTIIFHCDGDYHIESSTDSKYIDSLKKDYDNKLAYIVCKDDGEILEKYGWPHPVEQCIQMINVLKNKNGSCTVYKTHSFMYNGNGDRLGKKY